MKSIHRWPALLTGAFLVGLANLSAETTFPIDESPVDHSTGDAAVLSKVTPAIVSIFPAQLLTADEGAEDELMDRFFNRESDDEEKSRRKNSGSGVGGDSDFRRLYCHQ